MIERFRIFEPFADRLIAGMTTRRKLELPFHDLVELNQVHADHIVTVEKRPQARPQGDALITRQLNLPLVVRVADCQGILILDPKTRTIAAVHSGWRGSAANIIGKSIARLAELGCRPADLLVAVSPSLGPCCAEFTDPVRELPPALHPFIRDRHVDFWAASLAQCLDAGVRKEHIEAVHRCTKCHSDRYFSHRRGDTGRMKVFIGLQS